MGNHQKFIHIQQRGSEPFPWLHIQQLLKPASLTQPRVGSRRCGRRQAKAARVLQPNRSSMGRRTDTGVCCAKAGAGLRLRLGRAAAEGGCQWVIAPAGGAAPKCQAPAAGCYFSMIHALQVPCAGEHTIIRKCTRPSQGTGLQGCMLPQGFFGPLSHRRQGTERWQATACTKQNVKTD